jgi:hypothetical protein
VWLALAVRLSVPVRHPERGDSLPNVAQLCCTRGKPRAPRNAQLPVPSLAQARVSVFERPAAIMVHFALQPSEWAYIMQADRAKKRIRLMEDFPPYRRRGTQRVGSE